MAIVGAGPSGAFLAYLVAKAGWKVVILDKSSFPRDKVCGGGISHKTVELLGAEFDISPVIQQRIAGAFLTYRNSDTAEKVLHDRGGASVLRSEFDHFILTKAVEQGAQFVSGASFGAAQQANDVVTIETSGGILQARYLVGADGVFSQVRQKTFGPGLVTYAPAVEALVRVPESARRRFEGRVLFDFGGMPHGYGWIFPKKAHLNVGVFSVFPQDPTRIKRDLAAFMDLYESLKIREEVVYKGSCIPVRNAKHVYQDRRILLVGDAAGFAESVYGEGIYFALKSAEVAAKALLTASGRTTPADYHLALRKSGLLSDMRYSELNASLVFRFARQSFDLMVRNAAVNDLFAGLIAGGIGHKACFYRTLLTSPFWMINRRLVPQLGTDRL